MTAFEAFKEANDERLGEIEEKLISDVVTRDKVERINKAIDDQSRLIDELVLKKRRPPRRGEPRGRRSRTTSGLRGAKS